jgi:hypothetical protein
MPPAYVKPYVKRQKNDMADAEAMCEAVTRANMRFVPTKTPEQQSCLMLHRTRHLFIRQQTAVINSIRAHLAEFGIVAPVGRKGVTELLHVVADPSDKRVPEVARACLAALGTQASEAFLSGTDLRNTGRAFGTAIYWQAVGDEEPGRLGSREPGHAQRDAPEGSYNIPPLIFGPSNPAFLARRAYARLPSPTSSSAATSFAISSRPSAWS